MDSSLEGPLKIGDLHDITTYQAGVLQAAASRATRLHCDKILSTYGISKTEWLVIGSVLDAGQSGIHLTDLANLIDTTRVRIRRIVKKLEKQQMIIASGWGKARKPINVTIHPTFALDCPEIEQTLRQALRDSIYSKITPLELRMYLRVMHQLSLLP